MSAGIVKQPTISLLQYRTLRTETEIKEGNRKKQIETNSAVRRWQKLLTGGGLTQ
tara:strand:+ start:432 stop:596 length:165 start_codon:yes stop_codon:yes gene_type:complete